MSTCFKIKGLFPNGLQPFSSEQKLVSNPLLTSFPEQFAQPTVNYPHPNPEFHSVW